MLMKFSRNYKSDYAQVKISGKKSSLESCRIKYVDARGSYGELFPSNKDEDANRNNFHAGMLRNYHSHDYTK